MIFSALDQGGSIFTSWSVARRHSMVQLSDYEMGIQVQSAIPACKEGSNQSLNAAVRSSEPELTSVGTGTYRGILIFFYK